MIAFFSCLIMHSYAYLFENIGKWWIKVHLSVVHLFYDEYISYVLEYKKKHSNMQYVKKIMSMNTKIKRHKKEHLSKLFIVLDYFKQWWWYEYLSKIR